jgi:hypothetical protein
LREKKILDDVVRRIHDEDQRYTLWSRLWSLFCECSEFTFIIHVRSDHALTLQFQYNVNL